MQFSFLQLFPLLWGIEVSAKISTLKKWLIIFFPQGSYKLQRFLYILYKLYVHIYGLDILNSLISVKQLFHSIKFEIFIAEFG